MSAKFLTQIYNLFDFQNRPTIEERTIKVREDMAQNGNSSPALFIREAMDVWKVYLQDLFEFVAKEIKSKGYPQLINQEKPEFLFLLDQSLEVAKERIRKQTEVMCKPNEIQATMKRVGASFEQFKEYIIAKWDYEGDIFETRIPRKKTEIDFDLSKLNNDFQDLLKKICEAYINFKNIEPNEEPDSITLVLGDKFNTNQVRELGRFLENSDANFQIGNTYSLKDLANSVTLPTSDPGTEMVQTIIEEIEKLNQEATPKSSSFGPIEINKAKLSEDFRSVSWGETLTIGQSKAIRFMYEMQTKENAASFSTRLILEKSETSKTKLRDLFRDKYSKDKKAVHPLFDRMFELVKRGHYRLRI